MSLDSTPSSMPEEHLTVHKKNHDEPLSDCVRKAVDHYFEQIDGYRINRLYQLVIQEVERPLLERVLSHTGGNQTQGARLLGISRSTLRKKLALYGIE